MTNLKVSSSVLKSYKFTENAFLPNIVTIPLSQEKNCVCRCLVKPGDYVSEGDIIARPAAVQGYKGVIHSPIPGKVVDIISTTCPNGNLENAVRIKLSGSFSYLGKITPLTDWNMYSHGTLVSKLSEYGIINTFLTYEPLSLGDQVKNQLKRNKKCLIVRLFDEDPRRLSDALYTKFFFDQIITGVKITATAMEADHVIFAIDSNCLSRENIEKLNALTLEKNENARQSSFPSLNFTILQINSSKYPDGFKRELKLAFNKTFRKNLDFQISEDDLFVDSCTMYEVYKGIVTGEPSISKYIHVSGKCLHASGFLNIKLGFSIRDIVSQLGGFDQVPALVVINGSVCGYTVSSLDIPVTKYVKSIEFISDFYKTDYDIYDCSGCGNCRYTCPVNISPDKIYKFLTDRTEISENYKKSSLLCTECGLCNTVCPARLPLCQTITVLKEKLIEDSHKELDELNLHEDR